MSKRITIYTSLLLLTVGIFWGCSTEKNTSLSRGYHNLTSYYNVYFNGRESYKGGMLRIDAGYQDNYSEILKPFKFSDESIARTVYPDMDKAIKKASKLVKLHSIKAKPKRKKGKKSKKEREFYAKSEYNNFVDDAYLLMGQAHFMKHDFMQAIQNFEYVIQNFPKEEVRYDAYLWLTRTYNEQANYVKAREYLDFIEGDKKFPKKLKGDLYITYADYYLKQAKFEESIPYLKKAVEFGRKKKDRVRYKFILAQIHQKLEQYPSATEMYSQVIKSNPPYEMAFNAQIRKASSFSTKYGSGDDLIKELTKMLKDDKNIEFQDQIYFALAEIAMKQGDTPQALEYYKLSAEKSVANTDQKASSFLAMADIYFKVPEYRNAQTYYDSTLYFIDPAYEGYDALFDKTKSLTDLVENLDVIDFQDSVQYVASLSERDRDALIQKIIDEIIEEERKAKEMEQMAQMNAAMFKNQARDPRNRNLAAGGKWYFYNPTAISFGQSEFTKLWGRRKLEDNWRRKNKEMVMFEDEFAEEEGAEVDSTTMKPRPTDPKSKEYYMVDLPVNDSLVAISDGKIIDAFLNVAEIYKVQLEDYPLSVSTYADLNKRFPNHPFKLATYYNLFKLHRDLNQEPKSSTYRSKIINEYPDSKYAQMFTNPNYLQEMAGKQEKAKVLYEETYRAYTQENYDKVISNSTKAQNEYGESELLPKFLFIKALSLGETGDMDPFIDGLKFIVQNYPKSEVMAPARAILLRLKKEENLVDKLADLQDDGSKKAPEVVEEVIYFPNNKSPHFYVMAVPNKVTDVNRVKFDISNFNIDFFRMNSYNVSSVILNEDIQIVTVKNFDNAKKAVAYFETVMANLGYFKEIEGVNYRHFVISSDNFTTFFKDQDLNKYMKFFTKQYIETEE